MTSSILCRTLGAALLAAAAVCALDRGAHAQEPAAAAPQKADSLLDRAAAPGTPVASKPAEPPASAAAAPATDAERTTAAAPPDTTAQRPIARTAAKPVDRPRAAAAAETLPPVPERHMDLPEPAKERAENNAGSARTAKRNEARSGTEARRGRTPAAATNERSVARTAARVQTPGAGETRRPLREDRVLTRREEDRAGAREERVSAWQEREGRSRLRAEREREAPDVVRTRVSAGRNYDRPRLSELELARRAARRHVVDAPDGHVEAPYDGERVVIVRPRSYGRLYVVEE